MKKRLLFYNHKQIDGSNCYKDKFISDETLLYYCKLCEPNYILDDVECIIEYEPYDILLKFKNGKKYIYDKFSNSSRYIKYNTKNLTEDEWMLEFRIRMKDIMYRKNISQNMLAKKINVTQQQISKYIKGTNIPSYYIINKIADALKCDDDEIFFIPLILKEIYE